MESNIYYAKSDIMHDGVEYKRGERVSIGGDALKDLILAGVVGEEKPEETTEEIADNNAAEEKEEMIAEGKNTGDTLPNKTEVINETDDNGNVETKVVTGTDVEKVETDGEEKPEEDDISKDL